MGRVGNRNGMRGSRRGEVEGNQRKGVKVDRKKIPKLCSPSQISSQVIIRLVIGQLQCIHLFLWNLLIIIIIIIIVIIVIVIIAAVILNILKDKSICPCSFTFNAKLSQILWLLLSKSNHLQSFIHLDNLYSALSINILRGAPSPTTGKRSVKQLKDLEQLVQQRRVALW